MNLDKISEDRLFQNNTKEEIMHWSQTLQYFHYLRARGGHNCEGDSFGVYFKYEGRDDLITKLSKIGISLKPLEEGAIAFDPFATYSYDDLDKIKVTIPGCNDLEQPEYVEIFGYKAHIWIMNDNFGISISGSKDNLVYKVTDADYEVCLSLEKEFEKLSWKQYLDARIKEQIHCISKEKYPELF